MEGSGGATAPTWEGGGAGAAAREGGGGRGAAAHAGKLCECEWRDAGEL